MRNLPQAHAAAILVLVACTAVMLIFPGLAPAQGGQFEAACHMDTTSRTAASIAERWAQLQPVYTGAPYSVAPSTVSPYATGSLATGFLADGLNSLNWVRYLAGIPDDVFLDPTLVDYAQHGAVLVSASTLSHTPPKPADMDDAFYSAGYTGTSRSNLGLGYTTLAAFNIGCAEDDDNISTLGHRRWMLVPEMANTGMGYAGGYSAAYVFDRSRGYPFDYEAIKYPCAGYFPVEYLQPTTPWSITLNPARYTWTSAPHTVTLKRVGDGRTWTFDATDTDPAGEYYNFDTGGYGIANCFIFRPDSVTLGGYSAGDQFDVTLSGGIFMPDGLMPATVSYRVTLFSLSSPPTTPSTPTPPKPPTGINPVYRFYNLLTGAHFYTASYQEKIDVIAKLGKTYRYEGPAYQINMDSTSNSAPLYRLYNKKTGTHFYTADYQEKIDILTKYPDVYTYEGVGYNVSPAPVTGGATIYRFYNVKTGVHFYTASAQERDDVIARLGWLYVYEGEAYYLAP